MTPMHPLWPQDIGPTLGPKVEKPATPAPVVAEQWVKTATPGYVRSTVTGAVKKEATTNGVVLSISISLDQISQTIADAMTAIAMRNLERILSGQGSAT